MIKRQSKFIGLFSMIFIFAFLICLTACADNEIENAPQVCNHIDDDKNTVCDKCGKEGWCLSLCDKDKDYLCDECGLDFKTICKEHTDTDKNAKCDFCKTELPWQTVPTNATEGYCINHLDEESDRKCNNCGGVYFYNNSKLIVGGIDVSSRYYANIDENGECMIPFSAIARELGARVELIESIFLFTYNGEQLSIDTSKEGFGLGYLMTEVGAVINSELVLKSDIAIDLFQKWMGVCIRVDVKNKLIAAELLLNEWESDDDPMKRVNAKLIVGGKDITENNYVKIDYACGAEIPILAVLRELGYGLEFYADDYVVVKNGDKTNRIYYYDKEKEGEITTPSLMHCANRERIFDDIILYAHPVYSFSKWKGVINHKSLSGCDTNLTLWLGISIIIDYENLIVYVDRY